jgi:hypothetical protein
MPSQEAAEIAAHYANEGPVAAAARWLRLVLRDDRDEAWPLTDSALRMRFADAWVTANATPPLVRRYDAVDLVSALSVPVPDHDMWPAFATTQLREFSDTWSGIDWERRGWASRPRLVSPGVEIAVLVDAGGATVIEHDTIPPALGFVMCYEPDGGCSQASTIASGSEPWPWSWS